jgi:hypothetical protein
VIYLFGYIKTCSRVIRISTPTDIATELDG